MSLSQRYFFATRITSPTETESTAASISCGARRRPEVTIWRPMSSATAVVPSRPSRSDALSCALARETWGTVEQAVEYLQFGWMASLHAVQGLTSPSVG